MLRNIGILTFLGMLMSFVMYQPASIHTPPPDRALPDFMRSSTHWSDSIMSTLTIEEKISQSFMVAAAPNKGEDHLRKVDSLIHNLKVGGVILFQGERENTRDAIDRFQAGSNVPLLMGIDAEWGLDMRLWKGKRYPFQLTLGAANDIESTEIIAKSMGADLRELGIHLSFSPVIDVNTNPNNPVIGFRSFGESPLAVAKHGRAMIQGLQANNILSCMKHFPGHGDTDLDSHTTLPVVNKSKQELERFDWVPYKMGRLSGASAVMMAHLSVPSLDSTGTPASLSKTIIQDVLKGELKFDGLVISDALNMHAVAKRYGKSEVAVKAYLAGNDILLYPEEIGESIKLIVEAFNDGLISEAEINEKCRKILRAKFHAIHDRSALACPDDEKLEAAEFAVYEKALTVVKNENAIPVYDAIEKNLTINVGQDLNLFIERVEDYSSTDVLHAYSGAEAILRYASNWSGYDNIFVNICSSSMRSSDDYHYPDGWRALIDALPSQAKVYVTMFGNPYVAQDETDFDNADAVVLAFQQSDFGQDRAAQLIFGGYQSTTPLSITLNAIFQEGYFAETPPSSRLKYTVPLELGVRRLQLAEIDSIAINGIKEQAYPGCQIVVAKDGKVIYQKSFGHFTYDSIIHVDNSTIYDIASITKIAASTTSLMYLQDQGEFSLDSTLGDYIGELTRGTAYERILLRDMMAHQARLSPWIPFYTSTLVDGFPDKSIYSTVPNDSMSRTVAEGLFILDSYEEKMYARILRTGLKRYKKYKYSDLGYYFVKKIIEKTAEQPMQDFVWNTFYKPMGLKTMGYHPLEKFKKNQIAPTEQDTYFRHQLVHGHVHDMGAAMMDGVGGHAGIFSTATDLAALMQMFLNNGSYGRKRYLSEEVIDEYTSCQFCPGNRRGAGFDKPVRDLSGGPTCNLVSLSSFGHSGFTGTQVWADPANGVNYVFLSNRVYPSGENWKLVRLNIRTDIQRVIYELFPVDK
jgi:beta-glucosidase-like glycosyl hydrolase/CubicO group peptidase (beta-lactamase class C family)